MVIEPAFGTFGSVGRCQVMLENEISISISLSAEGSMKCSKNFLVDGRIDFGLDKTQWTNTSRWHAAQIITDCETSHWTSEQHGFCASPVFLQTLGPWFPNEMQNGPLSEKRTLDHWATVQFFFSLAQVRCFWRCCCFRSGLVALFLKMSELLVHWLQLQFTPREAFPSDWSALLDCIFKLAVIMLLVHIFYPIIPSSQLAFNMLWYSAPWTATPFSNDPLWLILFGGCQWSSSELLPSQQCSPLLCFQRTRDTHNLYCMDGHLLKLKCEYSNISRYWFWL